MVAITSWGRLSHDDQSVILLHDRFSAARQLQDNQATNGVAYGAGRSYGDACLNTYGTLWQTKNLNRFISFDPSAGLLTCEAGVQLKDIQQLFIQQGWQLAVTPGTKFVTVGGAIANDVHGKNHHVAGSFGDHVKHLTLVRTDGSTHICSPQTNPDLFAATIGGCGLTGVITQACLQLKRSPGSWIHAESIAYSNLDEFFTLADASEAGWEHTVSWIDCMSKHGRGIFMRGNPVAHPQPAQAEKQMVSVPFTPPISLINGVSLPILNSTYFNLQKLKKRQQIVDYRTFFYPLDNILSWNRLYGPKGFFQYQCVIPRSHGQSAIQSMLNEIVSAETGSFLAVLKTFGQREALGMLSFPQPGVTLALDFPNNGVKTLALFERLDRIVSEAQGRIYLAKDARMPRALFEAGYPKLNQFLQYRDPGISSNLSRRLMGY